MATIARNLSFKYTKHGEHKLNNLNFSFNSTGEFIAIVGETGAGKTTLLKHLNALLKPTGGEIEYDNFKIKAKRPIFRSLNFLRQKNALLFQFPEHQLFAETVEKDVCFGPKNFKKTKKQATALAKDALRLVGLAESFWQTSPFKLSGGETRKAALAGVLALSPEVILLDEPTRGLDLASVLNVLKLFKDWQKKTNGTVILITHYLEIAYKYATRVVYLESGKILADLPKSEFFSLNNDLPKPKIFKLLKNVNKQFNTDYSLELNADLTASFKKGELKWTGNKFLANTKTKVLF